MEDGTVSSGRQMTGKNSMNMMMIILLCGNLFVIGFLSLINHRVLLGCDIAVCHFCVTG